MSRSQYHCLNYGGLLEFCIFDVLYFFVLSLEVGSVDVRFFDSVSPFLFLFFSFLFFWPFRMPSAETHWYQMATKMPDAENKTDIVTWLVNCINTVFA